MSDYEKLYNDLVSTDVAEANDVGLFANLRETAGNQLEVTEADYRNTSIDRDSMMT